MRNLLLRDWKLYRFTLILPVSICLLWVFIPYMILANETKPLPLPVAFIALAIAPVMAALRVHGIHLLEMKNGTLPDLLALPVARPRLVYLRVVEGLTLTLVLLAPILLEGLVIRAIEGSANHLLPASITSALLNFGWLLLVGLLIPLPFTLRWGSRGFIGLAIAALVGIELTSALPNHALLRTLALIQRGLATPPWVQLPALMILSALTMFASTRSLYRQDL